MSKENPPETEQKNGQQEPQPEPSVKEKKKKQKAPEEVPPPPIIPWRRIFLYGSKLSALPAFIGMCICWVAPFPVVSLGENGYQVNPWDLRVFSLGLLFSFLTAAFALLGRGSGRRVFFMAGSVLFVLSVLGFISNHI
jgi:hypothetical protein